MSSFSSCKEGMTERRHRLLPRTKVDPPSLTPVKRHECVVYTE